MPIAKHSPFFMLAKESFKLTLPFLMDFISVPC